MKKRSLTIVILVILILIVTVITVDVLNNRPDRRGSNPYALEVDQYKEFDPSLLSHSEVRKLSLDPLKATALFIFDEQLYVTGDSSLLVLTADGALADQFDLLPGAGNLWVNRQSVFVAHGNFIARYGRESGKLEQQWTSLDERAVITGLAGNEEGLYVADAGNRRVLIYNFEGEDLGSFEGKAESEAGHGFIVPSANFDLLVNDFGELWVVNPGKHAIENYSDDGRLRGYWENSSFEIEGFLGCCNPARIAPMPEGRILTSEKGLVRIKIYAPSGELESVVAGPSVFKEEGKAPDVCALGERVYALDFDRNQIRIFEALENE